MQKFPRPQPLEELRREFCFHRHIVLTANTRLMSSSSMALTQESVKRSERCTDLSPRQARSPIF